MVDFLGIGAQKAGTTWLFHQLSRHPQIAFPAGKELHFWDRCDPALARRWADMLEPASRICPAGRPVRSGEITPAYAILPTDTIAAIRRCCPDVRLFISLRSPLERAWSAAVMDLRREGRTPAQTADAWFLDHFHSSASLARGDYAACLERWWSAFPREQLLVMVYDEIRLSPAAVLARLARHLAVDEADVAGTPAADLAEIVVPDLGPTSHDADRPPGPVPERFHAPLCDIYGSSIRRLARLVDLDFDAWLEPPDPGTAECRSRRVVDPSSAAAEGLPMRSAGEPPPQR
jgi:hypothetical protein